MSGARGMRPPVMGPGQSSGGHGRFVLSCCVHRGGGGGRTCNPLPLPPEDPSTHTNNNEGHRSTLTNHEGCPNHHQPPYDRTVHS